MERGFGKGGYLRGNGCLPMAFPPIRTKLALGEISTNLFVEYLGKPLAPAVDNSEKFGFGRFFGKLEKGLTKWSPRSGMVLGTNDFSNPNRLCTEI